MWSKRKTNDKAALTLTVFFKNLLPLPPFGSCCLPLAATIAVSITHFPSWILPLVFFWFFFGNPSA